MAINNNNFNNMLAAKGATAYSVSKETGIPYTTLSELKNNKLDINKCSYETLARLASFFQCRPENLVNPVQILRNISGKYRKYPYHWVINGETAELHMNDHGNDILLGKEKGLTQARFAREYREIPEVWIDIYLQQKEAEELLCRHTS